MRHRRIFGFSIGLTLAWLALHAQVSVQPRPKQGTAPPRPNTNLRVDTDLVLVPVAVSDPRNRPVTGLEREHFKLFDDKVEQTVTHFSMDDEPVAVGMVFDVSGSMNTKLRMSRVAAAEFFKTANVEDEFFLVTFSDQVKLAVGLTKDVQEIQNQLTFAQSKGRTALLDAIMLSMHEMKKSKKNRKALVVISDGGDNSSRYSENEVRNMVRENDVLIYAIGVYEHGGGRGRTVEEAAGPGLLGDMAEQTGGRHFPAEASELPDIAAKIGVELRNRYVLGYSPTDKQRDGRYHRVEVKIIAPRSMPKLTPHWRTGYYALAE